MRIRVTLVRLIRCLACFFLIYAIMLPARAAPVVRASDASLMEALVGTWETELSAKTFPFRKSFIRLNPDGTFESVVVGKLLDWDVRADFTGRWRIAGRKLIQEVVSASLPAKGRPPTLRVKSITPTTAAISTPDGDEHIRRGKWPRHLPPLITDVIDVPSDGELEKIIAANPKPKYPRTAEVLRKAGTGIFLLSADETGRVTSVAVAKSTGSPILDATATKTLQQWRLKPRTFKKILVPMSFRIYLT